MPDRTDESWRAQYAWERFAHVLPEVAVRRLDPWGRPLQEREVPGFPVACPKCGAEASARGGYYDPITYACGAAYALKPQIQNHTDKWWGGCPVTKAKFDAQAAQTQD